ncbi:MAG: penicillin-binding protein [Planctomycetota bacterium]|nr:MAG: penicillin-binding protein [Planctomycetota bacterium]
MNGPPEAWRRRAVRCAQALWLGLLLAFAALGWRLVRLQVVEARHWRALAVRQQQPLRAVPAYRGDIRTADGAVLARSVRAPSAFAEPRHMGRREGRRTLPPSPEELRAHARTIAQALGWDSAREHALFERLSHPARQGFCWIERRLDEHAAARLRAAAVPGVGFKPEYRRSYPCGPLAAHLIGFTRLDGEGELVGATGIEAAYEQVLAGVPGLQEVVRDARGARVLHEGNLLVPPEDGATVVLTIDSHLQRVVERALAEAAASWRPAGIAAVALRPADGRVLALASWPGYDPAALAGLTPAAQRNRPLMDTMEPGSILKPLIVAAALRAGAVHPGQRFDCTSPRRFGARTVRDVHPQGTLDLAGVLVHSSNVGMVQVAMALGPERLVELLGAAGFGLEPAIGLPLEERGSTTPLAEWSYHSTVSVAQGYELAVTPVQMASAFAALAAGGIRYRPQLVERVIDPSGRVIARFEPEPLGLLADARTCQQFLIPALVRVVEEGTGRRARLERWTVAGKTGTAKKVAPGGGYSADRYRASFIAFAPASRPELLVAVTVDEPQSPDGRVPYGGTVAAPIVKDILQEALLYLRVPPDRSPPVPASAGPAGGQG